MHCQEEATGNTYKYNNAHVNMHESTTCNCLCIVGSGLRVVEGRGRGGGRTQRIGLQRELHVLSVRQWGHPGWPVQIYGAPSQACQTVRTGVALQREYAMARQWTLEASMLHAASMLDSTGFHATCSETTGQCRHSWFTKLGM